MRKASAIMLLVLTAVIAASACGDKLLHLSRIHRFRALAANSSVVVYSRPNSLLEHAASFHLEKAFKSEGLNLRLVSSADSLAEEIRSGKTSVVIVDIADTGVVQGLPSSAPLLVVPVIAKDDHTNEAHAKRFPAVIKSPAKSDKFLDAVDRAVDAQWAQLEPKTRSR